MAARLIHQMLETASQKAPDSIFVTAGKVQRTYGEVETGANRIACLLGERKVGPGDRVILLAANSPSYIEAYYGILKAGAMVVSLHAAGDEPSQSAKIADCRPAGIICGPRQARRALSLASGCGVGFVLVLDQSIPEDRAELPDHCELLNGPELLPSCRSEPTGLDFPDSTRAAIIYTSGSTGKPRGVVLKHSNLMHNTASIVRYLELSASDSVMVVLPFHYVYGKSLLNTHVAVGGRVVLENRFMFPQEALNTLENEAVSGFAGVPSTFAILLNKSNFAKRALPALRYVTQAGGAMSTALQKRLMTAAKARQIYIMYGATEASARLSYLPPDDLPEKLGSIGKAIPGVTLTVRREDGSEAGTDEEGELVAEGANLMEAYWEAPEETRQVLQPDGYHTGDLARRDRDGYLYIVGRTREMIKSGAHRISPKEIEEKIAGHPAVAEVAVKGVPNERLGEEIHAFITLQVEGACSSRELLKWCRGTIAVYKCPHQIHIVSEFPRNDSGKIDKLAL